MTTLFHPEGAQEPSLSLAHSGARGRLTMSTRATVADDVFPVALGDGFLGLYAQPTTGAAVPRLTVSGKRRLTVPHTVRVAAGIPEHADLLVLTQTLHGQLYVTLMTPACVAAASELLWEQRRTWPRPASGGASPTPH